MRSATSGRAHRHRRPTACASAVDGSGDDALVDGDADDAAVEGGRGVRLPT
jgi:hypothetical protein